MKEVRLWKDLEVGNVYYILVGFKHIKYVLTNKGVTWFGEPYATFKMPGDHSNPMTIYKDELKHHFIEKE